MDETKPWPRAQQMPFVSAGERAQPHHFQAIAEYDEARGETTEYLSAHGTYTAAQVNEAITWWNKRAELETAVSGAMSEERLADIRAQVSDGAEAANIREQWAWGIAAELLAEVDQLRNRIGRTVALTDLGGYAGPITFVDDENGHPQPHWPSRP